MATPRKHWFRVADSILREPITLEQRGLLVSLQAYLNQRWARDGIAAEEAGTALIPWHDIASITLCDSFEEGVRTLREGLAWCSITFRIQGRALLVEWPKFSEFQQYDSRSRGAAQPASFASRSPSGTPPQTHTQDAEEEPPHSPPSKPRAPKAPPGPRAPPSGLCVAPESLDSEDLEKLIAWGATVGFSAADCDQAWERVRDWSHTNAKKRTRWWVVTKNAMQDGWALRPRARDSPRLSFGEQQAQENREWAERMRRESKSTDDHRTDRDPGHELPEHGGG